MTTIPATFRRTWLLFWTTHSLALQGPLLLPDEVYKIRFYNPSPSCAPGHQI